jgi:hypothetical protein
MAQACFRKIRWTEAGRVAMLANYMVGFRAHDLQCFEELIRQVLQPLWITVYRRHPTLLGPPDFPEALSSNTVQHPRFRETENTNILTFVFVCMFAV